MQTITCEMVRGKEWCVRSASINILVTTLRIFLTSNVSNIEKAAKGMGVKELQLSYNAMAKTEGIFI
jgi:hypothetical protein